MASRSGPPPIHYHPHLTTTLSPASALEHVSRFLRRTKKKPYLHPDSLLSTSGITYSAHSGPSGGLAIHHLRRIEAGLSGKHLVAELAEELAAFEEDGQAALPKSDDRRLDALIEQAEGGGGKKKGGLKRKRSMEEIGEWAESSSHAGAPDEDGDGTPQRYTELESFANTPLHVSDWQEQEEYELEQEPLEGEVGEREGAPVVKQNGDVPDVVEHDEDGRVMEKSKKKEKKRDKEGGKKDKTKVDPSERKAKKQARREALRHELAEKAKKGKG